MEVKKKSTPPQKNSLKKSWEKVWISIKKHYKKIISIFLIFICILIFILGQCKTQPEAFITLNSKYFELYSKEETIKTKEEIPFQFIRISGSRLYIENKEILINNIVRQDIGSPVIIESKEHIKLEKEDSNLSLISLEGLQDSKITLSTGNKSITLEFSTEQTVLTRGIIKVGFSFEVKDSNFLMIDQSNQNQYNFHKGDTVTFHMRVYAPNISFEPLSSLIQIQFKTSEEPPQGILFTNIKASRLVSYKIKKEFNNQIYYQPMIDEGKIVLISRSIDRKPFVIKEAHFKKPEFLVFPEKDIYNLSELTIKNQQLAVNLHKEKISSLILLKFSKVKESLIPSCLDWLFEEPFHKKVSISISSWIVIFSTGFGLVVWCFKKQTDKQKSNNMEKTGVDKTGDSNTS